MSWESSARQHVEAVAPDNAAGAEVKAQRDGEQTRQFKEVFVTNPDASMATTARNRWIEPAYKQHDVVDEVRDVVLDVDVATGGLNDPRRLADEPGSGPTPKLDNLLRAG